MKGLGEYFNVSLGPQLLYSVEKLQYRVNFIYGVNWIFKTEPKIQNFVHGANWIFKPEPKRMKNNWRPFSKEDCESAGAVQPADIYGSTHLLRLMVKVGTMDNILAMWGEIPSFATACMLNNLFPRLGTICPAATSKRRRQRFLDNPSKRNIFFQLSVSDDRGTHRGLPCLPRHQPKHVLLKWELFDGHHKKISHLTICRQKLPGCFVRLSTAMWNWQIGTNPSWMKDSTTKGHFRTTDVYRKWSCLFELLSLTQKAKNKHQTTLCFLGNERGQVKTSQKCSHSIWFGTA